MRWRQSSTRSGPRPRQRPEACGVGCGGPMLAGGEEVSPLNIPAWRGFPLHERLGRSRGAAGHHRQRRQGARPRRRLARSRPGLRRLSGHGGVDRGRRRHRPRRPAPRRRRGKRRPYRPRRRRARRSTMRVRWSGLPRGRGIGSVHRRHHRSTPPRRPPPRCASAAARWSAGRWLRWPTCWTSSWPWWAARWPSGSERSSSTPPSGRSTSAPGSNSPGRPASCPPGSVQTDRFSGPRRWRAARLAPASRTRRMSQDTAGGTSRRAMVADGRGAAPPTRAMGAAAAAVGHLARPGGGAGGPTCHCPTTACGPSAWRPRTGGPTRCPTPRTRSPTSSGAAEVVVRLLPKAATVGVPPGPAEQPQWPGRQAPSSEWARLSFGVDGSTGQAGGQAKGRCRRELDTRPDGAWAGVGQPGAPGAGAQCNVRTARSWSPPGERCCSCSTPRRSSCTRRTGCSGPSGSPSRSRRWCGWSAMSRCPGITGWPSTGGRCSPGTVPVASTADLAAENLDHVIPRSRGGPHTWENVVAACRRCNTRKEDRLPHEAGMVLRSTPVAPRHRVHLLALCGGAGEEWGTYLGSAFGLAPAVDGLIANGPRMPRPGAGGRLHGCHGAGGSTSGAGDAASPACLLARGGGVARRAGCRPLPRAGSVRSSWAPPSRQRSSTRCRRLAAGWASPGGDRAGVRCWSGPMSRCGSTCGYRRPIRLWSDDVGRAFDWVGDTWVVALERLGLSDLAAHRSGTLACTAWSKQVCFGGVGRGEVVEGGRRKVVGLAQRRTRAGAWFHCACALRWDPGPLVELLALSRKERVDAVCDLRDAAVGVADLAETAGAGRVGAAQVTAALLDALPTGSGS